MPFDEIRFFGDLAGAEYDSSATTFAATAVRS